MRADRAATLWFFRPAARFLGSTRRGRVPILMYHSISQDREQGVHPYYRTATFPQVFAQHLAYLRDNGYSAVTLAEAIGEPEAGGRARAKAVVITFDDGYRDFLTSAFPLLEQYGFRATVFLPTGYIADSPALLKERECLTWSEVRQLAQAGVVFGSHTVTHPQLYELDAPAVEREVLSSKRTIEDKLGREVDSFAYPYAFPAAAPAFKQNLSRLLRQGGYKYGVCTSIGIPGASFDPLFLPRLPMNSCDDLRLFEAKLAGAYNWLAAPQYLVKMAKRRLRHN